MTRCNPYGYGTDAGPQHLMGGMYGPEYAGKQVTTRDGIHGPAVCERPATMRVRLICAAGHQGPIMDVCTVCAAIMMGADEQRGSMLDCCTRCVWPDQARGLNESMEWIMREMAVARAAGDSYRYGRLEANLNDHARQMDELAAQGIIVKRPLKLVEVS